MATKQVIEIDVTWDGYSKLKLAALIKWLATLEETNPNLGILRFSVREVKKK